MWRLHILLISFLFIGCATKQNIIINNTCIPKWSCDKTLFSDKYIYFHGDFFNKDELSDIVVLSITFGIAKENLKKYIINKYLEKPITKLKLLKINTIIDQSIKKDYCENKQCTTFLFIKKSNIKNIFENK